MCMCMLANCRAEKGQALRGGRCLELAWVAFAPSVGGSCWEGTCSRAALLHGSFQRASWAGRWVLELVWGMVPRALEIESVCWSQNTSLHSQLPNSLGSLQFPQLGIHVRAIHGFLFLEYNFADKNFRTKIG